MLRDVMTAMDGVRDTAAMESASHPIGVAVLGAGRMGQTHIRNLAAIPGARVVVVADPDAEAAERGRVIARAERALTDAHDAIAAPGVEAVVIVTPTSTHAELIEAAVSAGKAVWSEKPIALDLAETARVVEVVRRSGQPLQIGFMRRFDPGYAAARARISAGELGRVEQFRALSRDTYPPSVEFLRHAGGIFLDMAVHDLDLARFLVGEVAEVQAWATVLADDRFAQADDFDTALTMLRFENGALGVVETARHSEWGYDIRTEVAGAVGKVVIEDHQKTPATFSRRFGYEGDHYQSFPDRFETAFRLELEAFIGALREGRPPTPGPEDALETLRLAVACARSQAEGRPVRVAELAA
jgi:myo-inositol 2-dehydrogenase/D-chiro-inositol 1-dehydrogenase